MPITRCTPCSTAGRRAAASSSTTTASFSSYKDIGPGQRGVHAGASARARAAGNMAVGHVRYGTTGGDDQQQRPAHCGQPHQGPHGAGAQRQSDQLPASCARSWSWQGSIFHTTSDTEVIAYVIAQERLKPPSIEEAVIRAMDRIEGRVFPGHHVARQAHRRARPARLPPALHTARLEDGRCVFASESCALDAVGARVRARCASRARSSWSTRTACAPITEPLRQGRRDALRVRVHLLRPPGLRHRRQQRPRRAPARGRVPGARASRCRRMSSSACRIPALTPPSATPGRAASPTASALSRTSTSAARSSQPTQTMRENEVSIKLNPIALRGARASASC